MYKTMMPAYLLTLCIGCKLTKNNLSRKDVKIVIFSAIFAYLIYSFFTLATFIKWLKMTASVVMTMFCLIMILLVVYFSYHNERQFRNFVNFFSDDRSVELRQAQGKMYLRVKRVTYIAYLYFFYECVIHIFMSSVTNNNQDDHIFMASFYLVQETIDFIILILLFT